MTTQDLRSALAEELTSRTSGPVMAAVGYALGVELSAPSDPAKVAGELPQVEAFYVSYGAEILAVYIASTGRLIRYELSRDGRYLAVCVPLSRIARIAETNENERLAVLIELDADRRSMSLSGQITTSTGTGVEGAGQRINIEGAMLSSAFMIEVSAVEAVELARFARQLRATMH